MRVGPQEYSILPGCLSLHLRRDAQIRLAVTAVAEVVRPAIQEEAVEESY